MQSHNRLENIFEMLGFSCVDDTFYSFNRRVGGVTMMVVVIIYDFAISIFVVFVIIIIT